MTPIAATGLLDNVRKFLMLITFTEGTDRQGTPYTELFGFTNFTGYDKHPNILIKSHNYSSTAAGRYQILKKTADFLKMPNFTPIAQDAAAVKLLKNAGAYNFIVAGDWENAIKKANKVWASLPESPYGQPTHTMESALNFIKTA